MRFTLPAFLLSIGCLVAVGCNSETATTETGSDPQPTEQLQAVAPVEATPVADTGHVSVSPAKAHVKADEPAVAVESFLSALQGEQGDVAFGLITARAREAMHSAGLSPQPVGSQSATYTVGRTEFVTPAKDGAYVSSIWSEPLGAGQFDQYEIVWVLRKEVTGWRIAGMASEVLPGQPPLFLDFENPAEMQRKLSEAEQTIAAANGESGVRQAQNVEPVNEPSQLR